MNFIIIYIFPFPHKVLHKIHDEILLISFRPLSRIFTGFMEVPQMGAKPLSRITLQALDKTYQQSVYDLHILLTCLDLNKQGPIH